MTVTNGVTKIEIHLLPGGGAVGPGPMRLPLPTIVSTQPVIADLRTLMEIKLSSYLGSPRSRLRDLADVVELIKANHLPRTFDLHRDVRPQYLETWDGLEEEAAR